MTDSRCILFIGGGIETIPGVQLAKSMGLHVVVSDADQNSPCVSLADDALIASTYDIDGSVGVAREYNDQVRPINGVICLATDVPLTVASVAESLNLPGIPVEAAKTVTDKLAMKDYLVSCGVLMPWYAPIKSVDELLKVISERGYSLVIKPTDSRGARGVLLLNPDIDLDWAFSVAQSFSPSNQVMVEEFLAGPQISTESLIIDGVIYTIGFSDRNYEFLARYSPHIIENGGDLPSFLSTENQISISEVVGLAAKSLKIENGVIKGDMVLSNGKPYAIEVALRLSGGYFCSHEIPLNTGVDFLGTAIRIALGDSIEINDLVPKRQQAVCQRYMFPEPGLVGSVYVPEWINEDPKIALYELRVKPGDIVAKAIHHPSRAGVVIATGVNREDAQRRAERAIIETKISTTPE